MKGMMEYRGYIGSAEFSPEDDVFHGKLQGLRDLVSYEGADVTSLKRSFEEAVDDYLETCAQLRKAPQRPFKGSFNVRVGQDLHMRAAALAATLGDPLNVVVRHALEAYVERQNPSTRRTIAVKRRGGPSGNH